MSVDEPRAVTLCGRSHGLNPRYVFVGTLVHIVGPAENATCSKCRKIAGEMED